VTVMNEEDVDGRLERTLVCNEWRQLVMQIVRLSG